MSQKAEPPTTQRAYTLRLQGTDRSDQSWRDALWQTHHAANKGSKAFGDWLLTMRGGLDHTLADAKIKGEKKEPDRDPTPPERKDRRILLALSWLSVESKRGAPKEFLVASGHAPAENRNGQVIKALERILEKRGVPKPTIGLWIDDCSASLSAAIRDDAVWINRSKAYDVAVSRIGETLTREELWDLLGRFYNDKERGKAKSAYLACVQLSDVDSSGSTKEEKAKDLVEKAGQWLSSRFGTGKGADFPRFAGAYEMIENWACTASPGVAGTDA
ncbi:MAG: type V CRISPR-associated protein Cas12b, partial [Planctomycetota bacterium]|nr:type V CRISPR-associated protein Cas12b [Planctomycetota bacterium]